MSAVTPPPSDAPTPMSAGHLIVRQLEAEGVRRVYTVPGESFLDVLDGLYDSPVHTVVCRQEGGAGFAALAEARLTHRPGIAMVTRGPGAANAMISIHTAYQDATALVLFMGLIPTEQRGREAFQEFDPHAWFGSTAKKVLILDHPDSAARIVSDALHTAASGRPGPVIVGLPEDTLLELTSSPPVPPRPLASPSPAPHEVAALEDAVASAARPLLVVGGQGWTPAAATSLSAWASARGVGIVADFRAHDAIDHAQDVFLGPLGYSSFAGTREAMADADLQILVGCVRGDIMTGSYAFGTSPDRTIVAVPDPDAHGHFGPLDQLIVATPETLATALGTGPGAAQVPATGTSVTGQTSGTGTSAAWYRPYRDRYQEWRTGVVGAERSDEFLDRDRAYRDAADVLPRDVVVTYGAGNYSAWALRYWPLQGPGSVAAPRNGAMGMGTPAAVAAKLAQPDRPVIGLAGDGCFMMNGQEFATAVDQGLNITVIVDDNSVFGTIVGHQVREYPGRPSGTSVTNPDFAALADSYGGRGFSVTRTEDFVPMLQEAMAYEGPALLHIRTDPEVRLPRT
ncbi:thiamine pyrophosphate-dependent enzyme [Brevibacterium senegalense]|uniref:thiamine pyrophosphate-dependent enzyme n=1 Tax=Brevibacterium senegalense TaxID=1033736 RepID=UPI00030D9E5F|nr:thiamine pyrophosphate-dependent enzyme [Brevibacterium senegalense]